MLTKFCFVFNVVCDVYVHSRPTSRTKFVCLSLTVDVPGPKNEEGFFLLYNELYYFSNRPTNFPAKI